jgi:aminopeptidase N
MSKGNKAKTDKATQTSIWTFSETPPISTYIFSLIAGPYKIWSSKAGETDLRLMCRKSMAQYVNENDWFKPTIAGLKFYNDYFGYPYPFEKYDQIIVPDFNPGAMENAGAVTFNERYISRGDESRRLKMRRSSVILHEMAHMWFGDLVTMKWWDGLWLNESFASYLAAIALYEATEFKEAWQRFYSGMKQWAYWEDQLVTTHPIELPVANTQEAFTNFDGITYGKGAASLKQLSYYIGKETFQKGVQKYFKKHAFGNTTLPDFMGTMEEAANKKLTAWTETWLETAGLNTISTHCQCTDGKIQSLALKQTVPEEYPTLRSHKTQIGLFYKTRSGEIVIKDSLPFIITGKEITLDTLQGRPCPAIIYPNYGDYGFFKVQLDEISIVTAMKNLSMIKDNFIRNMLWKNLFDMVTDAALPLNEYINLVFNNIGKEEDYSIISSVLSDIQKHAGYFFFNAKKDSQVNRYYLHSLKTLEKLMWDALKKAAPKSEVQKVWMDHYISGVYSEEGIRNLKDLLSGKVAINGITIDQDRRWSILIRLSVLGDATVKSLALKEHKRDSSSRGQRAAISVEAAFPEPAAKKRLYSIIQNIDTSMALAEKKAAIYNLFPANQQNLRISFSDNFFNFLPTLFKDNDQLLRYFLALGPTEPSKKNVTRIKKFLSGHPEAPPIVVKKLKILAQETERCINVQALARQGID